MNSAATNNERPLLIGCGILKREIRHLIEKNGWALDTLFLASTLHIDLDRLGSALAAALADGTIEAAGVDVLVVEPPDPANPLFKLPNIVLAPHNAAAALETYAKMSRRAALNLIEYFDGTLDPGYCVNPEALRKNS